MRLTLRVGAVLALAVPGAAIIYLGFNAGGFFAAAPGVIAAALALLLAARMLVARDPLGGVGGLAFAVAAALGLLAAWTLTSTAWSHAPGRALLEFDRVLLYLLALLFAVSVARTPDRLRWMLRGLAVAGFAISTAALVSRLLPHVWPVAQTVHPERASFPLTYWNGLGLVAALSALVCFYITTSEREPPVARVLSAAATAPLVTMVLLTFSRGAIVVGIGGLLAYVLLGRPRALVGGALATLPPAALALVAAYGADRISSSHPTSPAAVAQGHRVALAVAGASAIAALMRWSSLRLDLFVERRLSRLELPHPSRLQIAGTLAVALVAISGLTLALDVPASIGQQYRSFVRDSARLHHPNATRDRLADAGNGGRIPLWRVALRGYRSSPVHGTGAGTFEIIWNRQRPYEENVGEGHSVYLETLAELGVVGLVLLLMVVLGSLGGLARRIRGPDRTTHAILFAVALVWAVRAGFDWDWEMPAVTLWFFVAAGAGMARPAAAPPRTRRRSRGFRGGVALALAVVALTPASIALSQTRLDAGVRAFLRGDCVTAIDRALAAEGVAPPRPEPFELIAYCDARAGRGDLALAAMHNALRRDPQDWRLHYGMALILAAAGQSPLAEVRVAAQLNPLDPLIRRARIDFTPRNRRLWRRHALMSAIPLS